MTVWAAWQDGTAHAFDARRRSVTRTRCGRRVLPESMERPVERRCAACQADERRREREQTIRR